MKEQFRTYKIYKAKVVSVDPPNKGKKRRIMVSPLQHDGAGPYVKSASPPSWMPTSILGSGVTSFPDVGQECLVAENNSYRHIVSYIPKRHSSPYGLLEPRKTPEGGVSFGIAGMEEAFIDMSRKGTVKMHSNTFAQIGVDGVNKSILIKSFETKNEFAGGYKHHLYNKEGRLTPTQEVFNYKKDNPAFSDTNLELEEPYPTPIPPTNPPYKYVDKAIINSGFNEDNTIYNIETRQNVKSSPTGKDVVTRLALGYQKPYERWGEKIKYPKGTIIDWTGKKNITGEVGSFMLRWGKLGQNYKNEGTRGEIYRNQILEGLNNNKIYGNYQTNPAGRGEGYAYSKETDAKQQFTTSFGLLTDITDLEQKNSFYRQFLHLKDPSSKIWHKTLLGGDSGDLVWRSNLGKDKLSLNRELNLAEGGTYKLQYEKNSEKEYFMIKNKKIELKTSDDVYIRIDGEEINLKMRDSNLTLTPDGMWYNGKALVFETLIDFLNQNSPIIGMDSLGAPVPFHPSTKARFDKEDEKIHTEPQGFRTKGD